MAYHSAIYQSSSFNFLTYNGMMNNTLPTQAAHLLYCLDSNTTPEDGLLYQSALSYIQLDGSYASLDRIQQLFASMRRKAETTETLLEQAGGKNLLLLLTAYIGRMVSHELDDDVVWDDALGILSPDQQEAPVAIDDAWFDSVQLHAASQVFRPLTLIRQMLDHADEVKRSLKRQTADFIVSVSRADEDVSQLCYDLFEAMQLLKTPQDEQDASEKQQLARYIDITDISFIDELLDVELDYSLVSVMEIDQLLNRIKKTQQLRQRDYADFINHPPHAHFLYLIAHYVAASAAMQSRNTFYGLNYRNVAHLVSDDDAPFIFEYQYVCLVGKQLFYPLFTLVSQLFEDGASNSCVDFFNQIVSKHTGTLQLHSLSRAKQQPLGQISKSCNRVIEEMARQVTQALISIKNKQPVDTAIYHFDQYGHQQHALQYEHLSRKQMDSVLRDNRQGAEFGFGLLDEVVYLPQGKRDGIMVNLYDHAHAFSTELIVPYRYDNDRIMMYFVRSHQLHPHAGVDAGRINNIVAAFYRQVFTFTGESDAQASTDGVPFWQSHFYNPDMIPDALLSVPELTPTEHFLAYLPDNVDAKQQEHAQQHALKQTGGAVPRVESGATGYAAGSSRPDMGVVNRVELSTAASVDDPNALGEVHDVFELLAADNTDKKTPQHRSVITAAMVSESDASTRHDALESTALTDEEIISSFNSVAFDGALAGLKHSLSQSSIADKVDMQSVNDLSISDRAVDDLSVMAENNHADAMVLLSLHHYAKSDIKDKEKAFTWIKKAAKLDNEHAQYFLNQVFKHGWGIRANRQYSMFWLKLAASNGHTLAKVDVANQTRKQDMEGAVDKKKDINTTDLNDRMIQLLVFVFAFVVGLFVLSSWFF